MPGYSPGDLIDLAFSEESIEVIFSAGMDRPLRLTSPEATAMLVALRALVEVPGMVDPEAARSAIAKIESAAGAGQSAMPDEASAHESPAAAAVREAVRLHRAVAIDYYSASHDTTSHRVVDPIRILFVGDQSYLEAWCRSAEGVRLFRFDRIDSAEVLHEPSAPPPLAVEAAPDTALFDADPSLPAATLRIAPTATWMFDYFPMRLVRELPDGSCEAQMTYASEEWMARLVLGFGAAVTCWRRRRWQRRCEVPRRRRCGRMRLRHCGSIEATSGGKTMCERPTTLARAHPRRGGRSCCSVPRSCPTPPARSASRCGSSSRRSARCSMRGSRKMPPKANPVQSERVDPPAPEQNHTDAS